MSSQALKLVLPHVACSAQLALGVVFLLSALPKLRRPRAFARDVTAYEILPPSVACVFALVVIPLELFLAFAFLTGRLVIAALPVAMALLLAFLIAVGINLQRGRRVPCGCFGEASEPISPRAVARLLLLLAVTLLLAAVRSTGSSAWPPSGTLTADAAAIAHLLQAAALAAFLLLSGAWLLSLPELLPLARQWQRRQPPPGTVSAGSGVEGA